MNYWKCCVTFWLFVSASQAKDYNEDTKDSFNAFTTSMRDLAYELRNMSQIMLGLVRDMRDQLGALSFSVSTFGQEFRNDVLALKAMGAAMRDKLIDDNDLLKGIRHDVGQHLLLTDSIAKASSANTHVDCADWFHSGQKTSGVYRIRPSLVEDLHGSFDVYCDMETDGGGWTVFQKRGDFGLPEDYFFKTWSEYQVGFGYFNREFWLGNDRISSLTNQKNYHLRVDLTYMDNSRTYAKYHYFRVDNRYEMYKLHIGNFTGNAGDALSQLNEMRFSAKDHDNDRISRQCPFNCRTAWWFSTCTCYNLNGPNLQGKQARKGGAMEWHKWRGPLKSLVAAEMKIRPSDF